MLKWLKKRRWLTIDLVFAVILAVLYTIFSLEFEVIRFNINILFLASYLFLLLNILFFLLIFKMNQSLAESIHIVAFPFLSLIFLFAKWLPTIISRLDDMGESLTIGLLAYVLTMFAFFSVQLAIQRSAGSEETPKSPFIS